MCTLQLGHQESILLQKPYKQLIHTVLCCSAYFLLPFHICTHTNSVIHASTHCYVHTCVHVHAHTHVHTCTLIICTLTYSSDSVSSTGKENPCNLFSQCHRHSLVPRLLPVFQCYTQKNGGAWYLIAHDLRVQERPNSLAFSKRGDCHS